ncbi:MAG TPA: chemotaxis protein CheX [Fimbriimonadaceae bacterium]|nr:chemotaxis protein CheX [Fimbriimonadaceae bacterium]
MRTLQSAPRYGIVEPGFNVEARSDQELDVRKRVADPFVCAAFIVAENVLGETPVKGSVSLQSRSFGAGLVGIEVGVTGMIEGQVRFVMSDRTARRLAFALTGTSVRVLDEMAESAIAEFANMICGHGLLHLGELGEGCRLRPAVVFRRESESAPRSSRFLLVPLLTRRGEISVEIDLNAA